MTITEVGSIRLSLPARHKFVARGIRAGISNRVIAKVLGVDEGTVRRDRKFLATPENERPVRVARQKKPRKEKPVRELTPEERRQQHWEFMLTVAQLWIIREEHILPNLEMVLTDAGKLLYQHRDLLSQLPEPVKGPEELLSLTRPTETVEDYVPSKLPFYAKWLAHWLARCLPGKEGLQDEFFSQISIWARSQ